MATEVTGQHAGLNFAEVQSVTYRRNIIQKAVCELKFPTLYGLEREKPPPALATALRKLYPEHSTLDGVNVGPAGVAANFAYVFAEKKRGTQVVFRPSALSLETTKYQTFEDFINRLLVVVELAKGVIDADFFTRVGLRYINALPFDQPTVNNWVNPQLVGALASGMFGTPEEYGGRIAGRTEYGGFGFTHGLGQNTGSGKLEYLLDFDLWKEDVQLSEVREVVMRLHDQERRMFQWSLGQAALEYMGPAIPKEPSASVQRSLLRP